MLTLLFSTIVVMALLVWLANTFMPMDGRNRRRMDRVYLFCVLLYVVFAALIFSGPPPASY